MDKKKIEEDICRILRKYNVVNCLIDMEITKYILELHIVSKYSNHYDVLTHCTNCSFGKFKHKVSVPKGQPVGLYIRFVECPNCECRTLISKNT